MPIVKLLAKKSDHDLIVQSNKLIEARYSLSLGEQRLVLEMIAQIKPKDEEFHTYEINLAEWAKHFGLDRNKDIYARAKEISETLMSRVLNIPEPDGLLQVHWVSSAKYLNGKGVIEVSFDPKLKPYLLQMKAQFTPFSRHIVAQFTLVHAIRLYQLLKQYQTIGHRTISVVELRSILGITPGQYKRHVDFKRRVLVPSYKQINEKSDIAFEMEEIREGRGVKKIHFSIRKQQYQEQLPGDAQVPDGSRLTDQVDSSIPLAKELHRYGLSEKQATKLLREYEPDQVARNVKLLQERISAGQTPTNTGGFLRRAIIEDFAAETPLEIQIKEQEKTQKIAAQKILDDAAKAENEKQKTWAEWAERIDAYFIALPSSRQSELKQDFRLSPFLPVVARRTYDPDNMGPVAEAAFRRYIEEIMES